MTEKSSTPRTYVLVHGAGLGAFIWAKVQPLLEQGGHTVITLDLPGMGDDQTPPQLVTLEDEVQAVMGAIGTRRDVILVGHSFGVVVNAQVAERIPDQLDRLVYLSGNVVLDGESAAQVSQGDTGSLLTSNSVFADGLVGTPREWVGPALCSDCSQQDLQLVEDKIRATAPAPFMTPLQLSAERFGRVPKFIILTSQDHTTYPFQQQLQTRLPFEGAYTLDSSHLPVLSQPEKLVGVLQNIAAS